jgi:hypothetical protein
MALSLRASGAAVGILVASMLVWPEYLRIPMGLFEASAPRLIALMLIGRALVRGKHRELRSCRADKIVLAIWGWTILAAIIAGAMSSHVTSLIGRGFDTVLMYFVVRFYITSAENLKELMRWLSYVAIIMGILGIVETTSSWSPYGGMVAFRTWSWFPIEDQFRSGFMRAKGSTEIHIYFGIAMMLVTGILWSINKGFPFRRIGRWAILLGVLGTLSSMSSGPWLGCMLMFVFALYRTKTIWILRSIYLLVAIGLFLEVASNRHFYNLIDYVTLDPHTAWYRARLLEVAASHLSEFWLVGVGSQWPHHWAETLDGRNHVDIVNHFLLVALYGGLPALFMYIASHCIAISYVIDFWKSNADIPLRLVAFNLACVLIALDFSSMSVSLFGPPQILAHILLALIVAVTHMQKSAGQVPGTQSGSQTNVQLGER